MNLSNLAKLAAAMHCPTCSKPLAPAAAGALHCAAGHALQPDPVTQTFKFAEIDVGKYVEEYAQRYAGIWAYGYETLHRGEDESLYRSIASLVAEAMVATGEPLVVDAGCGVGRTTADCAALLPRAQILAIDASKHMLHWARQVVSGRGRVSCDLGRFGFGEVTIRGRGHNNVLFAEADVTAMPLADASVDLALSVNIIDRLPKGPAAKFDECARVLKPGGALVFSDPLNWDTRAGWDNHPTADDILRLIAQAGFEILTWFDNLVYRELLDARGSLEEFRTLIVHAHRK